MAATAPAKAISSPARTIQGLANIPTPKNSSEAAYLAASIHATAEQLALVIDLHAANLNKKLAKKGWGLDAFQARRRARTATAPLRQSAERIRGGAASGLVFWVRFMRTYMDLIKPASKDKGFNFTK